jgi:DNA-binding LacI/PurR family transcriptional regulator
LAKITSFDVARAAGVSQPTVSRALRNVPGTSPETRQRVRAAAAELGYVVSEVGRNLSTRRTGRVAVVSDELTNPYYPELVEPLRRVLAAAGLGMVIVSDSRRAAVTAEALADGSYDGVILTTTTRDSLLPRNLSARGVPHVLANRVLDVPECPSCSMDNRGGARGVAELLLSLGHSSIGWVQGPVDTSTGRGRAAALTEALRAAGVPPPREWRVRTAFDHDAALRAGLAMLGSTEPPTAVACGNDVIALGVLSAARRLGMRVPEDLTVIGFDDIGMASWPVIDLTTVHCDLERLADVAVHLLIEEMHERSAEPAEHVLPVSVVLRSTHGPPR